VINLPVGIFSLLMTYLFIDDPPYLRRTSRHIDGRGLGTLAVGMGAFQFMLDKGQEEDWFSSHLITALAVVALVGPTLFVIRE
jgi:DHA2 family multidrug resistance protein